MSSVRRVTAARALGCSALTACGSDAAAGAASAALGAFGSVAFGAAGTAADFAAAPEAALTVPTTFGVIFSAPASGLAPNTEENTSGMPLAYGFACIIGLAR